jgi:hypothetical protein
MSEDHTEKYLSAEVAKKRKAVSIYNETKKALETEERFVNLLKEYEPASVKRFIDYYAGMKAHWYEHGESFGNYLRSKENEWRDDAVESIKNIFYKKLFNLQCRWAAGEMDVPGIDISADFRRWQCDPSLSEGCLEPITDEEFQCYLDFLKWREENPVSQIDEDNEPLISLALDFFHHYRATAIDDEKEELPPWFEWYDTRFGTGHLNALPVMRIELEQDYHDIWNLEIFKKTLPEEAQKSLHHLSRAERKELRDDPAKREAYFAEQNRKYEERKKTQPQYESMGTYDREKMKTLVKLIETPEIQKLYHATREWSDRRARHDYIESPVFSLMEIKEWIPLDSNDDYRVAIREAYRNYSQKMMIMTLPLVFAEYKECIEAGKPFEWGGDKEFGDEMGQRILAARKWKGEPENFDFLKKENLPV